MSPDRKIRNTAVPSRPLQIGSTAALLILIPVLAATASDSLRAALDFTSGVLSLVSLTSAVAWGLLARDRLLLDPRQRILAQGIHRATAVASLGFMLLHAALKVALGHVALIGALLPFGLGVTGSGALIGLGSLAGFLMVTTAATGVLRSAFASPDRTVAGRWRALHALAYPAWCSALVHGLYAGRAPATWVVVMYCLCLAAVAVALVARLLPESVKREVRGYVADLTRDPARGAERAPRTGPRDPMHAPLPGSRPVPQDGRGSRTRRDAPASSVRTDPVFRSAGFPPADPPPRGPSAPTDPPLAERVPMTEELPIFQDPYGVPGGRDPYATPPRAPYAPYEGAVHDPLFQTPAPQAAAPRWPTPSPPPPSALDDTQPATAPLYPPPPGEPWSTPAGDRP
ncbi:hypothetical protein [Streptomyces sp. NPDC060194]|uniref:hypothetical protein n=1 Tax=Streptomyces sp. NPDC060194 TaxID=3347069 RepID=UPI00364DA8C1